jgi:hypothetical protein
VRPRDEYQKLLGKMNPRWEEFVKDAKGGKEIKTNPDGDVRFFFSLDLIRSESRVLHIADGRSERCEIRSIRRSWMSRM